MPCELVRSVAAAIAWATIGASATTLDLGLRDHPIATSTVPTYLENWTATGTAPGISVLKSRDLRSNRNFALYLRQMSRSDDAVCGSSPPHGQPVRVVGLGAVGLAQV